MSFSDIIFPTVALSIEEVCRCVSTSTTTYYKMRAAGQGPREMRMSNGVVRITPKAMREWGRPRKTSQFQEKRRRMKERSERAIAGAATAEGYGSRRCTGCGESTEGSTALTSSG